MTKTCPVRSTLFWPLELRTSELVWLKYSVPFLIRTERFFFFFVGRDFVFFHSLTITGHFRVVLNLITKAGLSEKLFKLK